MILRTDQNVGIGTTTPNTTLDVSGAFSQRGMTAPAVSTVGQGRIYFDSASNKFRVSENGGAYTDLVSSTSGFINNGNSFGSAATLGTNDNFALNFETNGTNRMTIGNNGDVGIGTSSPASKLHVAGTITNITGEINGVYNNISFNPSAPVTGGNLANGVKNEIWYNGSNDITSWYNYGSSTVAYNGLNSPAYMGTLTAVRGEAAIAQSGYTIDMSGVVGVAAKHNTGNIIRGYGVVGEVINNNATGSISNAYALRSTVTNPGGGTITNGYGLYVDNVQATNKWSMLCQRCNCTFILCWKRWNRHNDSIIAYSWCHNYERRHR